MVLSYVSWLQDDFGNAASPKPRQECHRYHPKAAAQARGGEALIWAGVEAGSAEIAQGIWLTRVEWMRKVAEGCCPSLATENRAGNASPPKSAPGECQGSDRGHFE